MEGCWKYAWIKGHEEPVDQNMSGYMEKIGGWQEALSFKVVADSCVSYPESLNLPQQDSLGEYSCST